MSPKIGYLKSSFEGRKIRALGSGGETHMTDQEKASPAAHFARLVSRIGHPLVFIMISAGIVVAKQLPARTAVPVLAALFISVILPTAFLLRAGAQSVRGSKVSEREERRRFYPWAIPFSALGAFLMWRMHTPIFVIRGALVMLALFLIAAVVNFWIKISLHTLFASYCTVILFQVGPVWGAGAALLTAFVFWSRLFLTRHTLIEVVAGVTLGIVGGVFAVGWLG